MAWTGCLLQHAVFLQERETESRMETVGICYRKRLDKICGRPFHIQKHTEKHFFMAEEALFPFVKGGMGESAPGAKFFHCHAVREIKKKDTENEREAVTSERDHLAWQ